MSDPLLLSADQTGALLGVSRGRVYELARLGILPHVRLGRQVRVSREALENFIAQGGCGLSAASRQQNGSMLAGHDVTPTKADDPKKGA